MAMIWPRLAHHHVLEAAGRLDGDGDWAERLQPCGQGIKPAGIARDREALVGFPHSAIRN
ncbi:hypothetical protein [Muricoccus vinaceus]|uniref:Uncharacterized protein n=1 Tax=Muricoccus vinaceus TaxID=424704 RepID=A0ABV6J1D6_9PROT